MENMSEWANWVVGGDIYTFYSQIIITSSNGSWELVPCNNVSFYRNRSSQEKKGERKKEGRKLLTLQLVRRGSTNRPSHCWCVAGHSHNTHSLLFICRRIEEHEEKEGRKDRLHKQQSPVVWRTSVDAADCCLCFRMPWSTRTYHYIFTSHFIWWQCINRKNQDGDTKTSRKHVLANLAVKLTNFG